MRHSLIRHLLIRSHWKKWLIPVLCLVPYLFSIFWLMISGLFWVAQLMFAPLAMGLLIALMTYLLARLEFRGTLR